MTSLVHLIITISYPASSPPVYILRYSLPQAQISTAFHALRRPVRWRQSADIKPLRSSQLSSRPVPGSSTLHLFPHHLIPHLPVFPARFSFLVCRFFHLFSLVAVFLSFSHPRSLSGELALEHLTSSRAWFPSTSRLQILQHVGGAGSHAR